MDIIRRGRQPSQDIVAFLGNLSEDYAENASGDVYLVVRWPPGAASWQITNLELLKPCTFWFRHEMQISPLSGQ